MEPTLFVTLSTTDQDVLVPNATPEVPSYDANSIPIAEAKPLPSSEAFNVQPIAIALQTPIARPMLACVNLPADTLQSALPMKNASQAFTKLLANVKINW